MTAEDEVAAILTGWTAIKCAHNGPFWTISGFDPYGNNHSGSRADPIELAHDLARLVEPPPVISPTPEAVQPTPQVEASAGVEEAPTASTPAAPQVEETPEPQHEPVPAYPGMMVREDRENYLRGQITVKATRIEQNRLQGRFDANARERQIWGFKEYHNANDLGLPISVEVHEAYNEFLAADGWIRATKAHADNLRAAAISVDLPMLEAMADQIEDGWP